MEDETAAPSSSEIDSPSTPSNDPSSSSGLNGLLLTLGTHAAQLLELFGGLWERQIRAREAEARHSLRMTYVASGLVGFVVGTAALLTYLDKIDGSTFTFMLGLIVGYVLTFIRDAIKPPPSS